MHFSASLSGSTGLRLLAVVAALAFVAAGIYLLKQEPPPVPAEPPLATAAPDPALVPAPVPPSLASLTTPSPHPALRPPAPVIPPIPSPPPAARPVTLAELEVAFLKAADLEARAEAASNLASLDSPEAITSLARLFVAHRAPDRVAIIGALGDSQSDEALPAKLDLLALALASTQSREVRRAAVDVAAQLDTPRARALLRQAAQSDPDSQVREVATAALADP